MVNEKTLFHDACRYMCQVSSLCTFDILSGFATHLDCALDKRQVPFSVKSLRSFVSKDDIQSKDDTQLGIKT